MIATFGAAGSLQPARIRPLGPFLGVLKCVQIGSAGMALTLHAHKKPGLIHHLEHDSHSLVFFTQEGNRCSCCSSPKFRVLVAEP